MRRLTVADYMTLAPHSIGLEQSLATAARRMREHHIRHLPVLEAGVLRGVLSERDVALIEALPNVEPNDISVEEAMTSEPYTVAATTPLARVARAMSQHKYGCAVVLDKGHVQGIFTTTDALAALSDVLEDSGAAHEAMAPSQVRAVILSEHVHLRTLLDRVESGAKRVLEGTAAGEHEIRMLRDAARNLLTAMGAHFELENRVLAPALADCDGFGKVRAEQLIEEHVEQKKEIEGIVMALDDTNQAGAAVSASVLRLIAAIRRDIDLEDESLLKGDLLRDDGIVADCTTG